MIKNKAIRCLDFLVVVLLILPLSGCSMALNGRIKPKVSDDKLIPAVARIVDEQLDVVSPYLEDDTVRAMINYDEITGNQVVNETLKEDKGHEYLEFSYDVAYSGEQNLEGFVEDAKTLLPEKEAEQLDEKINETKAIIYQKFDTVSRAVPPSQKVSFQKDLRKLVTRSVVLFTAGLVYTFMPKVMFWGKISAAAAISVAAGVLSCTIMSLYQYYKYGGDPQKSFAQWVNEISTDPQVSYAIAASMMAVGSTMKRSPVVTGIIICVFSLYKVIDMVKPMLSKYNFSA